MVNLANPPEKEEGGIYQVQYGGKYWNIKNYLPYQRCFNLIDSERTIGKTYTTQGFFIERALEKGERFVYVVRTQDEIKTGVFKEAFEKVLTQEYPEERITFNGNKCFYQPAPFFTADGKKVERSLETIGHVIALSEATKKKKINYPLVKWGMFDEYIVDEKEKNCYVGGWNEPELFLKIYHTIDREQDYVVFFLLANTIQFYNPYHMHPAFNIPNVGKDRVWYSENVLYHQVEASLELKQDKAKSKFLRMIQNTNYGKYAKDGTFVNDNIQFIEKRDTKARYAFTLSNDGFFFGVWIMPYKGKIYIDDKVDPSCKLIYALTLEDHSDNTMLTKGKSEILLNNLAKNFKLGNVRYTNMRVKARAEEAIKKLL